MVAKKVGVDYDMQGNVITNLGAPSGANDAARKAYVDTAVGGASLGLSWKQAVRVATTAAGTLATSFENGDTVDGVVLATGDRILIKDQAAPEENGIYAVAASGAPARTSDAGTAELILQTAVFVQEGTANADKLFLLTTNAPIVLGTTALTFTQFSSGGGGSLTVQEEDASPSDAAVTLIKVPNGYLVDNGAGDVSLLFPIALIEEHVVPVGGEASWTSAAIPGTFKDLRVTVEGACEGAVANDELMMRYNGDTGANYDSAEAPATDSSIGGLGFSAQTAHRVGWLAGSTAGAGRVARTVLDILNYTTTVWFKGFLSNSGLSNGTAAGNQWTGNRAGTWRNTAAITTLTFFALGGSDLAEGTVIRIYGLR